MATKLQQCKPEGLDWRDLGARNRRNMAEQCREDWSRVNTDLTATEVREALDVCRDTSRALDRYSCEQVVAIYAEDP